MIFFCLSRKVSLEKRRTSFQVKLTADTPHKATQFFSNASPFSSSYLEFWTSFGGCRKGMAAQRESPGPLIPSDDVCFLCVCMSMSERACQEKQHCRLSRSSLSLSHNICHSKANMTLTTSRLRAISSKMQWCCQSW